jgi:hypothetical protein
MAAAQVEDAGAIIAIYKRLFSSVDSPSVDSNVKLLCSHVKTSSHRSVTTTDPSLLINILVRGGFV